MSGPPPIPTAAPRAATILPSIAQAAPALLAAAARALGVPVERVNERDKHARVVWARQLAMAAARRRGYSLTEIGKAFNRNHSTVWHAQRIIAARAALDPSLARLLDLIAAREPAHLPDVAQNPMPLPASFAGLPALRRRRADRGPSARPTPSRYRRWLLSEVVGRYTTAAGEVRQVVFTEERLLLDRGADDERTIERFSRRVGLLEVAAVASSYLDEARRLKRPVVTATQGAG